MEKKEKQAIKREFVQRLRIFIENLRSYALVDDDQWAIKGFIDAFRNVYAISSDTKVVSKIIEIHLLPKILKFADENGFAVVLADHQNWYPDLSFVRKDDSEIKFAVDIKTTYRDPEHPGHCNGFTLGSHGTYFRNRNSKKNIQFPYSQYLAHLCIGIIYTRSDLEYISSVFRVKELLLSSSNQDSTDDNSVIHVDILRSITSVVRDFQFFVREKWEIASDRSGSGNTANIGSITKIDDIVNGNGTFKNLGEEWFDDFWMNYRRITIRVKGKSKPITNLQEYLKYRGQSSNLINPRAKKVRGGTG